MSGAASDDEVWLRLRDYVATTCGAAPERCRQLVDEAARELAS